MIVNTPAIVLHTLKYGERKLIVDLFTRQLGRLSFVMTMPKSVHGALKKQYFQPLTLLEVTFDHRPRVQLQKLTDARLLVPYTTIPLSPEKLSITLFIAEFLYYALRSEQRNDPLYDYISDSLQWLDAATQGVANFHLTFLMRLARFLGFYPRMEEVRGVFDLREGTFSEVVPTHPDFLQGREAEMVRLLMRMDFGSMHLFKFSREERQRILTVLMRYYQLHLPDFPELRSLAVLREVYAN